MINIMTALVELENPVFNQLIEELVTARRLYKASHSDYCRYQLVRAEQRLRSALLMVGAHN